MLNITGGYDATADLFIELSPGPVGKSQPRNTVQIGSRPFVLISALSGQHSEMQPDGMVRDPVSGEELDDWRWP